MRSSRVKASWCVLVGLGLWGCGARSDVSCFGNECVFADGDVGIGASGGVGGAETTVSPPDLPRGGAGGSSNAGAGATGMMPSFGGSVDEPGTPNVVVREGGQCTSPQGDETPVVITRAAELQALEGCQVIDGDLVLERFSTLDLSPLRSLQVVTGVFYINGLSGSLDGLESLQRVRGLDFSNFDALTLAPLSNLSIVDGGQIRIAGGTSIVDLTGLSRLIGMTSVKIEGNVFLASLSGLRVTVDGSVVSLRDNPSLVRLADAFAVSDLGELSIDNSPQLQSLSGLSGLTRVRSLDLDGLGVASLNELAAVAQIDSISLRDHPNLIEIDGVSAVEGLRELSVQRNSVLDHLPVFTRSIAQLGAVQVRDNPALLRGPAFPNAQFASRVVFVNNPQLGLIDGFSSLVQVGTLEVRQNEGLSGLDLGALGDFRALRVVCNPALSEVPLVGFRTLPGVEMNGNLDSIEPCRS